MEFVCLWVTQLCLMKSLPCWLAGQLRMKLRTHSLPFAQSGRPRRKLPKRSELRVKKPRLRLRLFADAKRVPASSFLGSQVVKRESYQLIVLILRLPSIHQRMEGIG